MLGPGKLNSQVHFIFHVWWFLQKKNEAEGRKALYILYIVCWLSVSIKCKLDFCISVCMCLLVRSCGFHWNDWSQSPYMNTLFANSHAHALAANMICWDFICWVHTYLTSWQVSLRNYGKENFSAQFYHGEKLLLESVSATHYQHEKIWPIHAGEIFVCRGWREVWDTSFLTCM